MLTLLLLIFVALAFDFMNGFHDAANSIATIVSTRVLTPRVAVAWAAFFNFVAAFGFGVAVATTIGKGIVAPEVIDNKVIFAALLAAFLWDVITWHYGLPSSSSHALIAGLAGAGWAKGGVGVLVPAGLTKVATFIVVSPIVGIGSSAAGPSTSISSI
jgi:PiT family inorganic phosphate transporter